MHMYAYYIHTVDTYMTAVCINVYMIMFNEYITALACFDGYAWNTTLNNSIAVITDRLRIALTLITDSYYWNFASLAKSDTWS